VYTSLHDALLCMREKGFRVAELLRGSKESYSQYAAIETLLFLIENTAENSLEEAFYYQKDWYVSTSMIYNRGATTFYFHKEFPLEAPQSKLSADRLQEIYCLFDEVE
jgi:hypothetical protein